ncbi:MAG TPA: hypothetical protein VFV07_08250 [Rhizomicrobium sp.]|nr:hypothetical protein [Rhizomicrobium sp.]
MADILQFQSLSRERPPQRAGAEDTAYSFWPEVECGLWHAQAAPDPANTPKRVALEIALILGGTAALCLLTTLLAAPPLS